MSVAFDFFLIAVILNKFFFEFLVLKFSGNALSGLKISNTENPKI
jgi:hypothetical protein